MITPGIFVTGTNTGVGKTVVSVALVRLLAGAGLRAVGLKPVASGAERAAPGGFLRNSDAIELQDASSGLPSYEDINPFCFEPPIAPHIAAAEAGIAVTGDALIQWYERVTAGMDIAVVEGAGGWRVPLHPAGFLSDLPERLGLGVVMVVGLTLGCLNHARLTAEVISTQARCPLLGWIGNEIDPGFNRRDENLKTLEHLLGARPLALIPRCDDAGPRSSRGLPLVDLGGAERLRTVLLSYQRKCAKGE